MSAKKLTVVISQGQSKNPKHRNLEEEIAMKLLLKGDVEVSLVPHLYDMSADHTGMLFLKSVPGDLVFLSWLYPRGARWILDRQNVRGHEGISLITSEEDDDDEEKPEELHPDAIGALEVPDRHIYCIDLRVHSDAEPYLEEIERIVEEDAKETVDLLSWITGEPNADQLKRYLAPQPTNGEQVILPSPQEDSAPKRRWYPVIDYSRCTNCMECIDFCLFGVYGVDSIDRILVEAQDNCKKGCPACSRVCPENAIIFPQHKTPAIAGADGEVAGLKIDLSKLFGGGAGDALETAVAERDAELVKDGRDAVGMEVGLPKRQVNRENRPKDALDNLMDDLDALEV
ncbi:ATP-binding protein [Thalassoglobus polymorphus]|uniref:4Fe-4S dicluster domain protein n=1 Tax=Thalassoglobus polymorphus TaxID=2527994 RepID=A0A517QNB8_9PLAN|nr:ferredoxin family protein [Thalassoglobus polymorphus]QDT33105.1 4Fe-4S dicluster domain protein [Thalassoglobus polymorphus]